MRTLLVSFVASLFVLVGCDAVSPEASASPEAEAKTAGQLTPIFGGTLGRYCVGAFYATPNPASAWIVRGGGAVILNSSSSTVSLETDASGDDVLVTWSSSGTQSDFVSVDPTSHCLTLVGPSEVGEFCNVEYYVQKPGTGYAYPSSINWSFDSDVYVNGPGSHGYPRSLSLLTDDRSFQITASTPVGNLTKTVTVSPQAGCP